MLCIVLFRQRQLLHLIEYKYTFKNKKGGEIFFQSIKFYTIRDLSIYLSINYLSIKFYLSIYLSAVNTNLPLQTHLCKLLSDRDDCQSGLHTSESKIGGLRFWKAKNYSSKLFLKSKKKQELLLLYLFKGSCING